MDNNIKRSLEVLELPANATLEEAKQAYRDLVIVWHPDKHHNNERLKNKADEKLKQINYAWDELKKYFSTLDQEIKERDEPNRREKAEREKRQKSEAERKQREQSEAENKRRQHEDKQKHSTYVVNCPYCGIANRIPHNKSLSSANCGSCGKSIDPQRATTDKAKAEQEKEQKQASKAQRHKNNLKRKELKKAGKVLYEQKSEQWKNENSKQCKESNPFPVGDPRWIECEKNAYYKSREYRQNKTKTLKESDVINEAFIEVVEIDMTNRIIALPEWYFHCLKCRILLPTDASCDLKCSCGAISLSPTIKHIQLPHRENYQVVKLIGKGVSAVSAPESTEVTPPENKPWWRFW